MEHVPLPDGRTIACTNPVDAQIWAGLQEDSPYDGGLAGLRAGDLVLDVGAHIGLTTLYFADQVPGVRVVAFEPSGDSYACLADNLRRLVPGALAENVALGAAAGTAELTFYPNHTMMATLAVDDADDERNMSAVLDNFGVDQSARTQFWRDFRAGARRSTVRVATLDEVFDRHRVTAVGLLKVDVERGELAVLRGLRDDRWAQVRQVVAEVHDIGTNLTDVVDLLHRQDYTTKVCQEPVFAGGSVHVVFASRPGAP